MIQEPRALIRMPDLVGLPLRKAKLLVENFGLRLDDVLFAESYEERDTVLSQRPARGQMIYKGERITLSVSRESYARFLPSIYQRSDVAGGNFVRDLLWITQHLFGSVEDVLEVIHTYFDPHLAPEEFLPWLASWTAMVVDEEWPLEQKRRLIKKAIELYKLRGTVKGLKLFIALFTGHEPEIIENVWPFAGCRIGVTSAVGLDTVILPPVNVAHTFIVEMPVTYDDLSVEAVIRLHEIIEMEKPAHTSYYLRFAAEERDAELREFFVIGDRSGIGIGAEVIHALPEGVALPGEEKPPEVRPADMPVDESVEEFAPPLRGKPPLPKAPRADNAPVEGIEARTNLAGGFDQGAREMRALSLEEIEAALAGRSNATRMMLAPGFGAEAAAGDTEPTTVEGPKPDGIRPDAGPDGNNDSKDRK